MVRPARQTLDTTKPSRANRVKPSVGAALGSGTEVLGDYWPDYWAIYTASAGTGRGATCTMEPLLREAGSSLAGS